MAEILVCMERFTLKKIRDKNGLRSISVLMSLKQLFNTFPYNGTIAWIGIRPTRGAPMAVLEQVQVTTDQGLVGDRFCGRPNNPRQVTLIQQEHLHVIASCLQKPEVPPEALRRNIVVEGLNLLALKNKQFRIGDAILAYTGLCHPCSKMEHILGPGGYNAMRGHGGITARVVSTGVIRLNDSISPIEEIDCPF